MILGLYQLSPTNDWGLCTSHAYTSILEGWTRVIQSSRRFCIQPSSPGKTAVVRDGRDAPLWIGLYLKHLQ